MTAVAPPRSPGTAWLAATAIVLSFAAGTTDAFAFLRLGGIFTANMTGNLVLIGLTERPRYANTLFGATVAVLVFATGVYVSTRIAVPGRTLRRGLTIVLGTTVLAQVAVLVGWIVSPQPVVLGAQGVLIALSAVAMAGQTSVSRRVEKHSGVTTTFVTGTITSLMSDFADRVQQDRGIRIGVVFALVLGALSGSLLISVDPAFGAALPLLPSVVGLALIVRMPTGPRPFQDALPGLPGTGHPRPLTRTTPPAPKTAKVEGPRSSLIIWESNRPETTYAAFQSSGEHRKKFSVRDARIQFK